MYVWVMYSVHTSRIGQRVFLEACSFSETQNLQPKAKMLRTPPRNITTLNLNASFWHKHSLLLIQTLAPWKLKYFFCSSGYFKWGNLSLSQECSALSEEMGKLKDFLTLPFASSHPQPLATTAAKKGQGCTSHATWATSNLEKKIFP